MEKEETEAMWEKLRELEQAITKLGGSNLEVAKEVAVSEISSAYHLIATLFLVVEPRGKADKGIAYVKYMYPRLESAQKAALSAQSMQEAFKIATDFHNDCFNYMKSQI